MNDVKNNNDKQLKEMERYFIDLNYRIQAEKKYKKVKQEIEEGNYYNSELFSIIDEIVLKDESKNFKSILSTGKKLFRAREINVEDYGKKGLDIKAKEPDSDYETSGYDECNSVECPLGKSKSGRNNIKGASYLYVALEEITACSEIKPTIRSLISLAEFEVMQPLNIIDFSCEKAFELELKGEFGISLGTFVTLLMFQYTEPVRDERDYYITQVISDYIRKYGVDGIAYKSFYTWGTNYTIFNSHKNKIQFKGSRIVSYQFNKQYFWDFNNKKIIQVLKDEDVEYNKEIADGMLQSMSSSFQKNKT